MRLTLLCLFFSLSLVAGALGQIYEVSRVEGTILLDGLVNESDWERIEPLPLTVYTPVYQGEPTENSEIRIAYDNQFFYTSAVFYDSDPNGILGNSLVRDVDNGGDFFNVLLDTYNDNENLNAFSTTPAGNRLDSEITNDAEGDFDAFWNGDYNAYWDTKVVVHDWGWTAEMRIPFSSLKFEDDQGDVVFGFITHRLIGRKNERHTFPAIPPNWEMGPWKASQAKKIRFRDLRQRKPLYVTPYLLGGYTEEGLSGDRSVEREAGFDLKYGISNNLNLDVTVNTDFAQVEVDDQQVNLTRFSLFFPEKRQFFQERAGIFSFTLGDQNRLFYSRQIGISSEGDPLRMYGGVRLTGRVNNLDVGVLNTQIAGGDSSPSENFGVIRLRQRAFNPYSFVGGMATTRIDEEGNSNINYGLDGVVRLNPDNPQLYLTVRLGQTFDSDSSSNPRDNSFSYVLLENRAISKLGFQLEFSRFGEDFNPEVGFNQRTNVTSAWQNIWYGFFLDQSPWLRIITPWAEVSSVFRNGENLLETQSTSVGLTFDLKSGTRFWLSGKRTLDRPLETFSLSEEATVMPGDHTFYAFKGSYSTTQGQRLGVTTTLELGEFYDGDITSVQVSPRWTVNKHLDLVTDLIYNRVTFGSRSQTFKGNLGRFRVNFAFDNHLSLNSFIQFNQADETMGINLRLRYNFREGTDLFIVFNQGNNTDTNSEVPDLIQRSVLVKYTHSLVRN